VCFLASCSMPNGGSIIVLDDRAARAEAIARNIPLLGTAGILLRDKEQGRIEFVRPTLYSVREITRVPTTASRPACPMWVGVAVCSI
jgi:predicted nucleic acid-binding protein